MTWSGVKPAGGTGGVAVGAGVSGRVGGATPPPLPLPEPGGPLPAPPLAPPPVPAPPVVAAGGGVVAGSAVAVGEGDGVSSTATTSGTSEIVRPRDVTTVSARCVAEGSAGGALPPPVA